MAVSKLSSLFALVALSSFSVAACAASTNATTDEPPPGDEQDLSIAKITACTADADCVAIMTVGCCPNGLDTAVNRDQIKAYEASSKCTNPHAICPMIMIRDTRIAQCNEKAGKCEMVAPKDCRTTGCSAGAKCQICRASYACVPNGAAC